MKAAFGLRAAAGFLLLLLSVLLLWQELLLPSWLPASPQRPAWRRPSWLQALRWFFWLLPYSSLLDGTHG
jgi:hypothetical protein